MQTTDIRVTSQTLQFVNSMVGRPGNIGARTAHVLDRIVKIDGNAACICRGVVHRTPGVTFRSMGWAGHVPRMLNALRIYLAPNFNHRRLDIALFQSFALRKLRDLMPEIPRGTAHVWDVCPELLRTLRRHGWYVVLDVPIAPMSYVRKLVESNVVDFLGVDRRIEKLEEEAFELADSIIVPSGFVAGELIEAGVDAGKIHVIEFGVNIPEREAAPGEQKNKNRLDFCFVGNVNRRKGVAELLAAWSNAVFSEDKLHLCGRVFPEVANHIERARGGVVMTPGFVDPYRYLPSCDIFVLPSWLEGSAKAVYEAMACGLPVITTHSTGSIVRDGIDGFIIQTGNVDELRERMLWLKERPDERRAMGIAARARAEAFSWERYARRVVNVYEQAERCA